MNPILLILAIVGAVVGGLSTIYLTLSFPAVIVWKLYRRVTQGISVTK